MSNEEVPEPDDTSDQLDTEELDELDEPATGPVPPLPPSVPPPPPGRRFVRDPYARFGGVASGLAHYFGWDVALTRLGVVLLFIVSGGTAILAYLLAWIIVPRATHWPPSGRSGPATRLSSRDVGIGLTVLGALLALAIVGGRPGAVLIPLALIGGGIWLLSQEPSGPTVTTPPPTPGRPLDPPLPPAPPMAYPEPTAPVSSGETTGTEPEIGSTMTATMMAPPPTVPPPAPPAPYDPGPPVPPRSRARRWIVRLLIAFVVLLLLLILAIPIVVFLVARSGNLDIDPDERVVVRPAVVSEIPELITEDAAEVVLDLRELEPEDFVGEDTPVEVEVDIDAGEIRVRLPDDLRVSVDASVGVGNVEVFDSESGGFFPDRRIDVDDAHVDLELDVGFGQIRVERT